MAKGPETSPEVARAVRRSTIPRSSRTAKLRRFQASGIGMRGMATRPPLAAPPNRCHQREKNFLNRCVYCGTRSYIAPAAFLIPSRQSGQEVCMRRVWQIQEAKNKLSEVVEGAL